ncbi:MAG: PD40 domain-containing protein [Desulfobulbaceae bacterium]
MFRHTIGVRVFIVFCCLLTAQTIQGAEPRTELISIDRNGKPCGGYSGNISGNGRYVAFTSSCNTIVAGDTNNRTDIFVRDRKTGITSRVSVNSDGSQANKDSGWPAISSNGRYVAFTSDASNLVAGDTNNRADIFRHDRQTGVTIRVSVDSAGNQSNQTSYSRTDISADGRYVVFSSRASNLVAGDTNDTSDVFLHDCQTGETVRVSVDSSGNEGNGKSEGASISSDGRYIAFASTATNLVADDTNNTSDIFVHDRVTGETTRVNLSSTGEESNAYDLGARISGNGRFVVFPSHASNLVDNDTNGILDIFRHDRETGMTERISVNKWGEQGQGPDLPHNLPVFISSKGRYIAFESFAANLVPDDPNGSGRDMFIKDMVNGNVGRVDFGFHATLKELTGISADGNFLVFYSNSDTLVPDDTNGVRDVFVYGPLLDSESSNQLFIPAIPTFLLSSP